MAELISISEARTHFFQILARVERGEEFIITRRGKPVVKIVPYRGDLGITQEKGGKHGPANRGL